MRRAVEAKLLAWKESDRRKPLVLLGMRQCGKTYILKEFGKSHYDDLAYFDFERNPQLGDIFRDLDPARITKELSAACGKSITERTLIVLDEVQNCYAALSSLKYFCQELPDQHIICAGSLLGLALADRKKKEAQNDACQHETSFPVGKVSFMRMWPMDFGEFVLATEGEELFGMMDGLSPCEELPGWLEERLETRYREYLLVGGMPESVQTWIDTESMEEVRKVQNDIIRSFKEDMGKYCRHDYQRITALWDSVAHQAAEAGDRFVLKKAGGTSRTLADPIQWLLDADLVKRVWEVNDDSVPQNPRGGVHYKLYLPDVGLLSCMAGVTAPMLNPADDRTSDIRGALAENYALNQMTSSLDIEGDAFFWANRKGDAEVDFQIRLGSDLVPVEVKSGKVGRPVSLEVYCDRYAPKAALVLSRKNVKLGKDGFSFVPLCMAWKVKAYLEALGLSRG